MRFYPKIALMIQYNLRNIIFRLNNAKASSTKRFAFSWEQDKRKHTGSNNSWIPN